RSRRGGPAGLRGPEAKRDAVPIDLAPPPRDLERWLAEHREPLIRRWLQLVVERSSLDELAARPLGERVRELDLLLEAARGTGDDAPRGAQVSDLCQAMIEAGRPFALVLLAPSLQGP